MVDPALTYPRKRRPNSLFAARQPAKMPMISAQRIGMKCDRLPTWFLCWKRNADLDKTKPSQEEGMSNMSHCPMGWQHRVDHIVYQALGLRAELAGLVGSRNESCSAGQAIIGQYSSVLYRESCSRGGRLCRFVFQVSGAETNETHLCNASQTTSTIQQLRAIGVIIPEYVSSSEHSQVSRFTWGERRCSRLSD